MGSVDLSYFDLFLTGGFVVLLAGALWKLQLGLSGTLLISAARMMVQLTVVGYVLKYLFDDGRLGLVTALSVLMLAVAVREIVSRQKRRLKGFKSYSVGALPLFVTSFAVTLFALTVIVQPDPWYLPQYAIPLLGMVMSNTMSAISLSMDRLTSSLHDNRMVIEQKLALGMSARESVRSYANDCIRTGIMPVVNSMATAGIVALPGMMTGQILGGAPPQVAVKYQILIWLLIAGSTGLGMIGALSLVQAQLFDERQRLRLDRLQSLK